MILKLSPWIKKGFIYSITSHSVNSKGERVSAREQLLRFKITGNNTRDLVAVTNLRQSIEGDDKLRASIEERSGENFNLDNLNIEDMAFHEESEHLLLGLRNPLAANSSVILTIVNSADMFADNTGPISGEPILLDMGGGIRALSFDLVLETFLLVNEIDSENGKKVSQLWTWSGSSTDAPLPLTLSAIINLDNVESLPAPP